MLASNSEACLGNVKKNTHFREFCSVFRSLIGNILPRTDVGIRSSKKDIIPEFFREKSRIKDFSGQKRD